MNEAPTDSFDSQTENRLWALELRAGRPGSASLTLQAGPEHACTTRSLENLERMHERADVRLSQNVGLLGSHCQGHRLLEPTSWTEWRGEWHPHFSGATLRSCGFRGRKGSGEKGGRKGAGSFCSPSYQGTANKVAQPQKPSLPGALAPLPIPSPAPTIPFTGPGRTS